MEITANASQTVASGQAVLFTETPISGNCAILHKEGSGLTKLRGFTNGQCRARFRVTFGGNIAAATTAAAISLALTIDGEPVNTSSMVVTPAATDEFFNVSTSLFLDVPKGCCSTVAVRNTSTQSIIIENANLIIERVA